MLFDIVVLGKEVAGLEVARHAAELGQRVALIDDRDHFAKPGAYDCGWQTPETIDEFCGSTRFVTPDTLEIRSSEKAQQIRGRRFVLACGSRAKRPQHVVFDGQRILDSDEAADREPHLRSWLVVGAGDHGVEAARQLTAQGARVSIVDQYFPASDRFHSRASREAWDGIQELQCPVHWGTTILGAERRNSSVMVYHENGSIETYEGVVFAVGRVGCTNHLQLPRPDLLLDETQRVWCNEFGQTGFPHIFAVGAVVGFPRTAASPEQQAARVIEHIFQEEVPFSHWNKPRTGNLLVS